MTHFERGGASAEALADREVVAIVEHYERIARAGRLSDLAPWEKAEFDAAWNEALRRELRFGGGA